MKRLALALVFLAFLAIGAGAVPSWLDNSTAIPAVYDYNTLSIFNITWNDTEGVSIDTVFIESNFSGVATNYTMTLIDAYINATENKGVYNFNLTLPAGSFYWKSYANNSLGEWTASDTWYFAIDKATPALTLTASPSWSVLYPKETTVTGSESNLGDDDLTYNLYRNDALVSNPDVATLAVGSYSYIYNSTSGQNYTANSVSNTLTVNPLNSCAVLDTAGGYYTLTADIIDSSASTCMDIQADNIVLDCQGHLIDGVNATNTKAVSVNSRNNITVKNCVLTEWWRPITVTNSNDIIVRNNSINCSSFATGVTGIRPGSTNNLLIESNNISSCRYGIWTDTGLNNTIFRYNIFNNTNKVVLEIGQYNYNNSVINNTFDIRGGALITGIGIMSGSKNITIKNNTIILDNPRAKDSLVLASNDYPTTHDIDESNTINGKPIKFYNSVSNIQPDITGYSEVLCANCSNVTFRNANLYGLQIMYSNNTTINDLTSTAQHPILFIYSLDNKVYGVTLKSDWTGLDIEYTNNTKIYNSIVESIHPTYAFYLLETYNNLFYNNLFNVSSIYFDGTNINYWNTTRQTGSRIYSAGTEIGGNYWTNATGNGYSDTCIDADKDGFCDDPYVLDANNADYLALSDEYVAPPLVSGVPLLSRTLVGIAIGFGVLAFMLKTLFDIKEPKKVVEYFIALAVIVLTVIALIVLFA
jgi:hypothetical protein